VLLAQRLVGRYPGVSETARDHSPNLSDPTGAQSSQSSTIPVTLCKAMYFSAVMKVSPSRGSCTSRWHPHFSHASGSHWRGSELVVMPASSQPAAAYPFGRIGQLPGSWRDHRGAEPDDHTGSNGPRDPATPAPVVGSAQAGMEVRTLKSLWPRLGTTPLAGSLERSANEGDLVSLQVEARTCK
jgi:hypothetical protein